MQWQLTSFAQARTTKPNRRGRPLRRPLAARLWMRGSGLLLLAVLLGLGLGANARAETNGVLREVYTGLISSSLLGLTNDSSFPDFPTYSEVLTNGYETPNNYSDYYGQRLRALVVPPVSGEYVFWISADDQGALFLSPDESPYDRIKIAEVTNTVRFGSWYAFPSQQSTNLYLEAGRRYYLEALQSAGMGYDFLMVGWKLPDGTFEQPIPVNRLRAFGQAPTSAPVLTSHPTSVTVLENASVQFRVAVANTDEIDYQWQRDGVNLPADLGATYTLPLARTNDSGARFRCVVSNLFGTQTSLEAVLTVLPDTDPPLLATVANLTSNRVQIRFTEPVEEDSATNLANYTLSAGITVADAAFGESPDEIYLTTTPLTRGVPYTLTVNNVRDRAAARNVIVPNAQQTFTVLLKGIYREVYTNIHSQFLADLTNNPAFPDQPGQVELMTNAFETPGREMHNYGQRLRARLLPPMTGNYTFWLAADDTGALFLGTNATSASARQIAWVTADRSVAARQWGVQPNQQSAVIPLVAGQEYYIEALSQAALAGGFPPDHLAVRWQRPDGVFEGPIPTAHLAPYGMPLPVIVAQPTNTTVVEGAAATFSVRVSNLDPVQYQWRQNGTPVPGATNASYTLNRVALSDHGSIFQCALVNAIGSTNTLAATLMVTPDNTPPALVDVRNEGEQQVVVFFSEPVEAASATAAANYSLTGASVLNVAPRAGENAVTLLTTPLVFGSNYTVTVNGVRDQAATPNTIAPNSQFTFLAADFFPQDIGNPALPGSIAFVPGGVDLSASGSGIGDVSDQFGYGYQQLRGDFDVKVRVQALDFSDPWTRAGLMAREDLGTNSVFAAVFATPSVAGAFFQSRTNAGATPRIAGNFPVNYPRTWLRLQRIGGTQFNGYASYDGHTWTRLGTAFLALPSTIYLGFAVSSHNPAQAVTAQFRDYADSTGEVEGTLPVETEPLGPSTRRTGLVFSEIMYHPAPRTDGRRLEFIELYNTNPFYEDISGFRISGDVSYTFPSGTVLQGGAFLVIARSPLDVQAVYGITNIVGPYAKNLSNKSGTVRLRNRTDAILLEVNYDSEPPWPVQADGAGHSLVLARPSYGEDNVRSWGASDLIGGSPGKVDGLYFEPVRYIRINEILAHTDLPAVDYLELYNHSTATVDLSGCWLSDDFRTNKFRIPDGTSVGPTGFVAFTETTLGFALSAAGEAVYLINSNQTRVVDAVLFPGQENGVASGRYPDGTAGFVPLAAQTPGGPNTARRLPEVVINEIMYHPITDDDNDEFVELHNLTGAPIDLTNWRLRDGIAFDFPTNTVLPAHGYLVVAKNAAQLIAKYPNLDANNTVGNFDRTLSNGGERLVLSKPDTLLTTNLVGIVSTNVFYIEVNEVTYGTGGRWGNWSDGDGSSLELIDPRSDNRLAANWTDSDDTAKSTWTTLSITGVLDNANDSQSDWDSLQLYLLDPGEVLVDNVEVRLPDVARGANLVTNSTFQSGLNFWFPQGNHRQSYLENSGFNSSRSLHVVASDRGDTGANRIYTLLTDSYTTNLTGTIAAKVKWLHGRPEILFRLRGNHLELPGVLDVPANLGTPGERNSVYAANLGPAIADVQPDPVLPEADQPLVVRARVQDPDGVAAVQLTWRADPFGTPATVPMTDNGANGDDIPGDGVYAGTIPGQPDDTLVAFYIEATDGFSPAASTRFPNDAPARECLAHFGNEEPMGTYGTYRFWLTQASLNNWLIHEKFSNEPFPGTFVYGNYRVMYNAASHYAGSPAHTKLYDSPIGTNCDYQILLPKDDMLLNADSVRVQQPGLFGKDATGQDEQIGFWLVSQFDVPSLYRRSVNMFINGIHRGVIYEDTQRPTSDFDEEWYPDSDMGDLYKVAYWYEYGDDTTHHNNTLPSLQPFLTTGGQKKLARYRQNFPRRAVKDSAHNYTNLFNLVDILNTTATGQEYADRVFPEVDITEWARSFAVERIINNTDLYGSLRIKGDRTKPGGQNAFLFKPQNDSWKFFIWDIDAAFSGEPTDSLFDFTDPPITYLFSQPLVLRVYWQALEDAAYGPLEPSNLHPIIDAKYEAYLDSGINADAPDQVKAFLEDRRQYILWLLAQADVDFAITSHPDSSFTNDSTLLALEGTAPISARHITINGLEYPLTWTSATNWSVQLPLSSASNHFVLHGRDAAGNVLSDATLNLTVYFDGPISRPEDSLVINEVMFNPAETNASYVELYNRSTHTTFSLANYRLKGVDFNFPPGAIMGPDSYLLVVQNQAAFAAAYGAGLPVAGEFKGNLDPDGERLTLIQRGWTTNDADVIIDQVKYRIDPPWPAAPGVPGSGTALELIDAAQDNARVSNWADGAGWRFFSATGRPGGSRLYLYLDGAGEVFIDDLRLVLGTVPAAGPNYVRNGDFEAPLSGDWDFLGSSGANNSTVSSAAAYSGNQSLRLVFTRSGSTSRSLYQDITSINTSSTYTLSFWYRPTTDGRRLTVRVGGSSFSPQLDLSPVLATPGAPNAVAGAVPPYPLLWLNEVQPDNPDGLRDNTGAAEPWLELYNSSTNAIPLDGLSLSKDYDDLNQWTFPAGTVVGPGEFRVVFVDGHPERSTGAVLHASFRLDATHGSIVLSRDQQILDYLNYTNLTDGLSFGSWPDGQLFDRQVFYFVTPGAANNPAPIPVAINEWMASNTRTLLDPATLTFADWFELYNFGLTPVNLSGYYLTDNLNDDKRWRIPDGVFLAPQSFLLCWADNDPTGTNTIGDALHVNFQLSKKGDQLGLFSPAGVPVDTVAFGSQGRDISMGRFADGNVNGVLHFMLTPTPGTNNVVTNNAYAPVLVAIPDFTIDEESLLTFTAVAFDNDVPAQQLTYSVEPGAPQGVSIDPVTGAFSWTPLESQGGAAYFITIRVTDNGSPLLSDTKTFQVTVNEANTPPLLNPVADQAVDPGELLSLSLSATDTDLPPQALAFALLAAPTGASVNSAGLFTWTPSAAQSSSTNPVIVTVVDNGAPSLSATQTFTVVVHAGSGCTGFMADVAPRPNGNGSVSISDWVQVGRFAAGLDVAAEGCELTKADCAPKPSGNGSVTISDWVQAGRYAAGLDPVVAVGGGSPPGFAPSAGSYRGGKQSTHSFTAGAERVVSIQAPTFWSRQTNCLRIVLEAQGDENSIGLSLNFDTRLLTFVSARADTNLVGAFFLQNTNQVPAGNLGLAIGLPFGTAFSAGTHVVAEVCFAAAEVVESELTSITMGDQPVGRELVDVLAGPLPATYENATIEISDDVVIRTIVVTPGQDVVLTLIGPPGEVWDLQASPDLSQWQHVTTLTNATGTVEYTDPNPAPANPRFYRIARP